MKKNLLIAMIAFLSFSAAAESKLMCLDLFSKKGAKPFLTATIVRDDELTDVKLYQGKDLAFDTKEMKTSAVGSEITTSRSPYKGHREFFLGTKEIRLILPLNLSAQNLSRTSFAAGALPKNLQKRQNGVLDVAGRRYANDQSGDGFTRMHCISK